MYQTYIFDVSLIKLSKNDLDLLFSAWMILPLKANIEQSISATCTKLAYWMYLWSNFHKMTLTYFFCLSGFAFKSQYTCTKKYVWIEFCCHEVSFVICDYLCFTSCTCPIYLTYFSTNLWFAIGYIFWVVSDRALIFHICIPYEKTFLNIP